MPSTFVGFLLNFISLLEYSNYNFY